jgi:hypothetical protein
MQRKCHKVFLLALATGRTTAPPRTNRGASSLTLSVYNISAVSYKSSSILRTAVPHHRNGTRVPSSRDLRLEETVEVRPAIVSGLLESHWMQETGPFRFLSLQVTNGETFPRAFLFFHFLVCSTRNGSRQQGHMSHLGSGVRWIAARIGPLHHA